MKKINNMTADRILAQCMPNGENGNFVIDDNVFPIPMFYDNSKDKGKADADDFYEYI